MPTVKFASLVAAAILAAALPAAADDLSSSIMRPTAVNPTIGMVAGNLPGGNGAKSYYVAVDLKPGELLTQLQIAGRANGERRLTVQLLDGEAKVAATTFVRAGFGALDETTKSFAIDAAGRHVMRLTVEGEETGTFCLLMGGTALPDAKPPTCPAAAAAAVAPPPAPPPVAEAPAPAPAPVVEAHPPAAAPAVVEAAPAPKIVELAPAPRQIEVIVSQCEERLRVGSDFLFDFDRAQVRPEADGALEEVATRVNAAGKRVMVEGHTDAKGTDSYNQTLSERRASAVRLALIDRGVSDAQMIVHGFGKSRPIAPNAHEDGSDDPDGRQKNRRVEVVINTCN
jgi:outer membrane protein OmpA-like peptidoglycan-associated protein